MVPTTPVTDAHFRSLVEAVQDYAIYMLDPEGRVTSWNAGAERNKGYKSADILGHHYRCFFLREDVERGIPEHALEEAERCSHFASEGWRVRKNGTIFWAGVAINAMRDEDGRLIGYAKVTRDLTERKLNEERLRESEHALQNERDRLRALVHSIGDGVISVDSYGCIVLMNPVAEQLTGYSAKHVGRRQVADVLQLIDTETGQSLGNPAALSFEPSEGIRLQQNTALIARDGVRRDVRLSNAPIRNDDGELTGAVLTFQDVTSLRATLREIEFNAKHDALTHLPNRRQFEQALERARTKAGDEQTVCALCVLDLDHFKEVNDTGGHPAGDALLQEISTLLSQGVRRKDVIARLGGDEFAIILDDVSLEEAGLILEKIRGKIADLRFSWEDHTFSISASIGIAPITPEFDMQSVIRNADRACYRAKHQGRNRVCLHTSDVCGTDLHGTDHNEVESRQAVHLA